jgi:HupE / UreJ protein
LLVVTLGNRVIAETLLDSNSGSVTIELEGRSPSAARSAIRFLELGLRHILAGYDHLVFLAGLLLAASGVRELVIALTAFTAAHSISLALVVIGGFHAPPSIVEPLIAASIAWVGIENLLQRGHGTRWVVFGFGLIHGFGFAGALMELGFGSSAIEMALALLSFNAGLETGQLVAASAVFPLIWMVRMRPQWRARLLPCCSAMIVMAGGYWLIERVL